MNRIDVIEWYDGEVQFFLEASGSYFYGLCVGIEFDQTEIDRNFILIPISAEDKIEIENVLSSDNPARLNNLLPRILEGRAATSVAGSLEMWDAKAANFSLDAAAYKAFMRFPLIDILAGIDKSS